MNRNDITTARDEAQRFIDRCDAAYNAFEWRKFNDGSGGYWNNTDTRHSASLKRASMDLTRSLAALRKPGA